MPGFTDADIYPLEHPNLERARQLARGNMRGGRAVLYAQNIPNALATAQTIKQQLAEIGLDIEVRSLPQGGPFFSKLFTPGEPWDLAPLFWAPDFIDPFQYTNLLFDPQFASIGNVGRFDSRTFNSQMRRAARLVGSARYRTYADLDVRLARDAAPSAPISFLNEATLVSKRVGCVVLRPTLDLTAVCLK
jgi:ABC-type transport system substrate-binding protein